MQKKDFFVLDAHCDTVSLAYDNGESVAENGLHLDVRRQQAYRGFIQTYAIWIDDFFAVNMPLKKTMVLIDFYYREMERAGVVPITTRAGLDACISGDGIGAILAVEGGEAIEGDLSVLRNLYRMGVRLMTLTWNRRNAIADGVALRESKNGLSAFGREVVAEMNRIGMVVDVSHANERTFYEVAEMTTKPIVASHSNAAALCGFFRNLTDDQFCVLMKNGGVTGLNLCDEFLTDGGVGCDVDAALAHLDHFLSLGGEKNIGLGGDLDGVDRLPQGMCGVEDYDRLIEGMLRRNYSETLVEDILYGNFARVFRDNFVE